MIVATDGNIKRLEELEIESSNLNDDETDVNNETNNTMVGIRPFIHKLIHPKFRYIRDLYPIMFFLDVLCFLIVAFSYSSFGEGGTGDVVNDIQVIF